MSIYRRSLSGLMSLLIVCAVVITSGPPTIAAFQTAGDARSAFEVAIAEYNQSNPEALIKLLTLGQTNGWAVGYLGYISRQTGRELPTQPSVALAHMVDGTWQVSLPLERNTSQYNAWLTMLDSQLLSDEIKDRLHFPSGTNQPQGVATATGYELPWAGGWGGTLVRRHDENGTTNPNGNNYDFNLWEGSTAGTNNANVNKSGYIVAAKSGTVAYVKENSSHTGCDDSSCAGKANVVIIQHSANEFSWYYHLAPYSVPNDIWPGKQVVTGTVIGQEGTTGWSTGDHLHFMVSDWMRSDKIGVTETDPDYAPWPSGHIIPVTFNAGVTQISNNYPPTSYAVVLYWDADYRGPAVRLTSLDAIQNCCDLQPWFNDRASSVRVYAGFSIKLFEHFGRNGGWKVFSASDNNLDNDTFNNGTGINDQVTAYELTAPSACFPPAGTQAVSVCDPPPPPNDTTPPSGYFTAPANGTTISASSVTISVNASDNSGGSGVREVRFSAKWSGTWRGIGISYSSPYSFNWDMCAASVPNGDIELGMEVWDNANNQWIYSEHYSNPHITKNYTCPANPPPPPQSNGVDLFTDPNYAGYHFVTPLTIDLPDLGAATNGLFHDNIESARVIGQYSYVLYENENYSGAYLYQSGSPNLNDQGWGNRADSIRVRNGDYNASAFTLYSLGDFNGEAWPSDRTIYDLGHWQKNDWAESLRVASGYGIVACEHDNFHGTCGRATGPAQFSDINALAQGLRHGVSSVHVCAGTCPNGASSPILASPANGETIPAGSTIILQWYGDGDQFRLELWGGGLGGTQTWGWNNGTQYNAGQLPVSNNPYYWKVQASNGFGDSGWSQGIFYVTPPTVKPLTVFVVSGAAKNVAVPFAKWPERFTAPATAMSFFPGNSINLFVRAQNTFGSEVTAYFIWRVTDPLGRLIPALSWEGNLSTSSGIVDWYLPTMIPAYSISGNYTFEGSITYGGQTFTQTTVFSVVGPDTAESVGAYITAGTQSQGAPQANQPQSLMTPNSSLHLDNVTANFNIGDSVELHMLVYNNASTSLVVHMRWLVIDPQGRQLWALSYEGDLETGAGLTDWYLGNNIPTNAVTGDYYFLGEVVYEDRITQVSDSFFVQGVAPAGLDVIGSAHVIPTIPYDEWRDTWNTTASPQDPVLSCTGMPNSNSVWYRLTTISSGRISIDTFESTYDTVVGVFSGMPNSLTEIACDDDFYDSSRTSRVEFQATAGVSYYIVVMDWNTPDGGWLHLQVNPLRSVFLPFITR